MGELMDVLDPAPSSTRRAQGGYPMRQSVTRTGVRAHNETLFLLNLLAYEVLHFGRARMEKTTGEGWSLCRFRERLLRVAGRVVRHGRRLTFVIARRIGGDCGASSTAFNGPPVGWVGERIHPSWRAGRRARGSLRFNTGKPSPLV